MSASLADRVAAGDPLALARALSLVEEKTPQGEAILAELFGRTGGATVIGITGPPGAGKSSLVTRLIARYRERDASIGVIAIDPSSAFSGGAILGDRIRMQEHTLDPGVFIRSMASRGLFGGLSRCTRDAVDLVDASGRDPILLETVGVGQDEIDVVRVADTVLVVLTPGQGDDIQAIKAGILEIADIFVINKADHPGADRLISELEGMLALGEPRAWRPPIVTTVATTGDGVDRLHAAIEEHAGHLRRSGARAARRRAGLTTRLLEIVRERILEGLLGGRDGEAILEDCQERMQSGALDPYTAAREVIGRLTAAESSPVHGHAAAGGGAVLDHLGVAVRSIEERVSLYRDLLGLEMQGVEEVAGEQVRVAMLPAGRTRIELVQPLSEDSTVARFLAKRGEGIHHVCFQVDDLRAALERMRGAGLAAAGDTDRPGAEGSRVAFIHPRGTGGILIELRQAAPAGPKPGRRSTRERGIDR